MPQRVHCCVQPLNTEPPLHPEVLRLRRRRRRRAAAPARGASRVLAAPARARARRQPRQDPLPAEGAARQGLGQGAELPAQRPQARLPLRADARRHPPAPAADAGLPGAQGARVRGAALADLGAAQGSREPGRNAAVSAALLTVVPVILAGGSGTRLWPLSRVAASEAIPLARRRRGSERDAVPAGRAARSPSLAEAGIAVQRAVHRRQRGASLHGRSSSCATSASSRRACCSSRSAATPRRRSRLAALEATRAAPAGADPILVVTPADHADRRARGLHRGAAPGRAQAAATAASSSSASGPIGPTPATATSAPSDAPTPTRRRRSARRRLRREARPRDRRALRRRRRLLLEQRHVRAARERLARRAARAFAPTSPPPAKPPSHTRTADAAFLRFDAAAFAAIPGREHRLRRDGAGEPRRLGHRRSAWSRSTPAGATSAPGTRSGRSARATATATPRTATRWCATRATRSSTRPAGWSA